MHRRSAALVVAILHAISAGLAAEPATTPPLSGPSVPEEAESRRIERDFEGNMKPLEVRPEVAALNELSLSESERAKVDEILAHRNATTTRLIRENIDLLLRAQSVREGNDPEARRALLEDFREAFKDLSTNGPLAEQLAGAMTAENAEKFNEINRQYWRELVTQNSKDGPDRPRGKAAVTRAALKLLAQEIKQSYERTIAEGKERLDQVIARLELTPEQDAKVRAIVTEFGQQTKLNPTGTQRIALFTRIAQVLTPEQRQKAFDLVRGGE